jgi:hypothetical protein
MISSSGGGTSRPKVSVEPPFDDDHPRDEGSRVNGRAPNHPLENIVDRYHRHDLRQDIAAV